jgi:hypothetical protein
MPEPFYFRSEVHLITLLGLKASNPAELLACLRLVPNASIYYHTHRFLQQHHYLSPEPPNDFAYWATEILGLEDLGERLASIDVVQFCSIDDLRKAFIESLSDYINRGKHCLDCERGEEFHFMSCITVVMPTSYVARNAGEFLDIIPKLSIHSLYFHVFEARMRLCNAENDFSRWFRDLGMNELAQEVSRLDPYTITLEGLRKKISKAVSRYV